MGKEQVTVKLEERTLKRIDQMARKLNLTRSQFVRNCIDSGFETHKSISKILKKR